MEVLLTSEVTDMTAKVMVEVLSIGGIAIKETKQETSELFLYKLGSAGWEPSAFFEDIWYGILQHPTSIQRAL